MSGGGGGGAIFGSVIFVKLFFVKLFFVKFTLFLQKSEGAKAPPQPLPLCGPCNFKERPQRERSIGKKTADRLHFDKYNSQDLTSRTDHLHVR